MVRGLRASKDGMLTEDYKVRLDAFEGPLDLLLYLIRKNEVEIHDIPVAGIAEQYMSFLGHIEHVDIDVAGEFLVMAATLTEIKSRMLSPTPIPASADGDAADAGREDPRAELVRQLLAYKSYRDAAAGLDRRQIEWQSRYPSGTVLPDGRSAEVKAIKEALAAQAAATDIEDLSLVDLVEAFRKVMETVNFDRLGDHTVTYDDTPIEAHAEDILKVLTGTADGNTGNMSQTHGVEFASLFTGKTRSQAVGLFLALLVLVRDRKVAVAQDKIDGSITLTVATPSEAEAAVMLSPTSPTSPDESAGTGGKE